MLLEICTKSRELHVSAHFQNKCEECYFKNVIMNYNRASATVTGYTTLSIVINNIL